MLPIQDGFTVCRRLRDQGVDTPILMVTARDGVGDRVRGLDTGADDYLVKPFAFDEVVARLRALTRRGRTRSLSAVLTTGALSLDQEAHQAAVAGTLLPLTATEYRLLEFLMRRAGTIVSRDQLAEHVWGGDYDPGSNLADVYVGYLRRKLAGTAAADQIRTDPGPRLHARARRAVMARPLSFRARLTLRWTIAFGLLLACANAAVYLGVRTYAERDLDANLRTLAATEIASSTDAGGVLHVHELGAEALGGGDFAGKFVQYYALDGTTVFGSALLNGARVLDAEGFAGALAGDHRVTTVHVGERRGRVVTARINDADTSYVAAVGLFTDDLDLLLSRLAWVLGGVWILGVAATAWIGFLLASRALEPIDEITTRAGRIAMGDIHVRLAPPRSDDEIGRMTRLLNQMLDRLHGVIEGNRRFAADASHELRTPLTAMAGEIDVTLKRDRTPEEYCETLRRLRRQIDGLTTLAEHLMLLARAEERPGDLAAEEVPVRELVDSACARVGPLAAARGIALASAGLDELVAYAQPGLLARAIENVVANAVQYNRDGGTVQITGFDEPTPGDAWEASRVRLEITDSGPGIPPEEWERVFDRFYRREPSRSRRTGGAGLGLALSRAIATLHGGALRVRASSDAGTTFELVLPGQRHG